jgi:hypothetical protein
VLFVDVDISVCVQLRLLLTLLIFTGKIHFMFLPNWPSSVVQVLQWVLEGDCHYRECFLDGYHTILPTTKQGASDKTNEHI